MKPTHVIVDKRKYNGRGKWRLGVIYQPKHGRVHLMSYKHKEDAETAAYAVGRAFKVPVTIFSTSGINANSKTKDFS